MLGESISKMNVLDQAMSTWSGLVESVSQESSMVATITMAFSSDPVARWVYPRATDYYRWFPEFVRAFAGRSIDDRTALATANYSGVALWLAPDAHADEKALIRLVEDSLPAERHPELFELFEKMDDGHPAESHWYLPMIGVDTIRQNSGIGTGLMKLALDRSDREGRPAYLESSNPRNISLYQRCGFEAIGEIRAGGSPPLVRMLRAPGK
jgi:ribosomal protein S18 acetylase RimI-like enzyme